MFLILTDIFDLAAVFRDAFLFLSKSRKGVSSEGFSALEGERRLPNEAFLSGD